MKTTTTIRFMPRLKRAVTTTESGITMRGNWVLRTMLSWPTTEPTAPEVDSEKKLKRTTLKSRRTG